MACTESRATPVTSEEFAQAMQPLNHYIGDTVAIAVSGGADSMALTVLLQQWAKRHHKQVLALTVDHAIRKESAQEAQQVRSWLTQQGIQHDILTWVGEIPTSNIQEQARNIRYDLMEERCKQKGVSTLCLAHHQDDQAETILMRCMRGSGVNGLCGMRPISHYRRLVLLRPLLAIPKQRLEQTLKEHQAEWIEDPSNQNLQFTRVQVREFLAKNPLAEGDPALFKKRLCDIGAHMQRVKSLLDELTDMAERQVTYHSKQATFSVKHLQALHPEIALRLLARILMRVSQAEKPPRFEKLTALYEGLQAAPSVVRTLHGCQLNKQQDTVTCNQEPKKG